MALRAKGSWRPFIQALPILIVGYVSTILICAVLFATFEGKPVDVGIWWSFVTAMTIGYVPDIVYAPELRYLDEIPGVRDPVLRDRKSTRLNSSHCTPSRMPSSA